MSQHLYQPASIPDSSPMQLPGLVLYGARMIMEAETASISAMRSASSKLALYTVDDFITWKSFAF